MLFTPHGISSFTFLTNFLSGITKQETNVQSTFAGWTVIFFNQQMFGAVSTIEPALDLDVNITDLEIRFVFVELGWL